MAASNITAPNGLIQGSALDYTSAGLSNLVRNPLTASLNCAQFEVQNSGRVNTSILETEQIQLKPGSLLTAITLGETILASSGCNGITFQNATPALSCGAAAQLSVGNVAEGAGIVLDTTADTVTVTGPLAAQLSQVGQATILAAASSVSVVDADITASSKVFVQVVGAAPDATAKSFSVALSAGVGFDIVADAAATAGTVLDYFIAAY
jgi:hypothetical protein